MPLDVQAATVEREPLPAIQPPALPQIETADLKRIVDLYNRSERPILLVGGGIGYAVAESFARKCSPRAFRQ